jgi:hypothetical protein
MAVLGIHSNYDNDDSSSSAGGSTAASSGQGGGSSGRGTAGSSTKIGGHAWISVTENAKTTCYGLWPDNHPNTIDNGNGTDIREGLESINQARASRYYELTAGQAAKLKRELQSNVTWNYTHNCSSWASELIYRVVERDVDADDWGLLGVETPRKLTKSILLLEAKSPTSKLTPIPAGGTS